ncbi:MAG TPA: hypothetical protein PKO06_21765 [Candidatus Ozemobacteraceae bacterium]|nr:hypothetical protein [Candidatus Ozemobacteraceae bacterium]
MCAQSLGTDTKASTIVVREYAQGTLKHPARIIEARYKSSHQKPPSVTFNQGTIGPIQYASPEEVVGLEILPHTPYAFSTQKGVTLSFVYEPIPDAAETSTIPPEQNALEIEADNSDQTFEQKFKLDSFVQAGGFNTDAPSLVITVDGNILPENMFQPASAALGAFIVEPGHTYRFKAPVGSRLILRFMPVSP